MSKKSNTHTIPMTDIPCPRCMKLALNGTLRAEMVQPLPAGAFAPQARDNSGKCCRDCASADGVSAVMKNIDFTMARVAVGNDRQEQLRLPGAPIGLVKNHMMHPSQPGDFDRHMEWLDRNGWFGQREGKD